MKSALVCLVASGCSLYATKNPQPYPAPPACSESNGPPALDSLIGIGSIIAGTAFGISTEFADTKEEEESRALSAGLFTLSGIGFSASAFIGGMRVRRCKKAHDAFNAMQHPQYPQPYGYPPQPYPPQPYPPQPYPPQPYPPQPYPPQPQPQPQPAPR